MTAILIGSLPSANFIVADSIVSLSLTVSNYKECRMIDKIMGVNNNEQYMVVLGEEMIRFAAEFLSEWGRIKGVEIDLLKTSNFVELLTCAMKYRQYSIDLQKVNPIIQANTFVYIVNRDEIKEYKVLFNDSYTISNERIFGVTECILNYGGNITNINTPEVGVDLLKFGTDEITKEDEFRKTKGYKEGKPPLKYNFEGRFSSVIIPKGRNTAAKRTSPFKDFTELMLLHGPYWDYINKPDFKWSPNIN